MAVKSTTMDFKWNYSVEGIVERKGFGTNLNRVFAETLAEYAEDLTPMESGALRESVQIKANKQRGTVSYTVPYSQYQYQLKAKSRHTPYTYDHWLQWAWTLYKPQITGTVGAYRRWYSK